VWRADPMTEVVELNEVEIEAVAGGTGNISAF
jgi:hypothetical protein